MDFDDAACERVQRFWQSPTIARGPGLKAVELFEAIAAGRVKAVWIMATNPAVSLPAVNRVNQALARCDLVVVSDCVRRTDTTAHAQVLLPATTWGEKDGTITNSERRISRQRAFLQAPGEARPDWWMITQIARRMGFTDGFPYASAGEIFREHAALSGFENHGERAFDIHGLAHLDDPAYDALSPIQWPVPHQAHQGTARMFAGQAFHTASGRARFIPVQPRPPVAGPSRSYPFYLNTGRIRDQWHTMTRTGTVPRLTAHIAEPRVEIHPDDAADLDLQDGALARLSNATGTMLARVHLAEGQLPDTLFVPIHWSERFAAEARVNALVPPVTDPLSGEPEFKHTPIAVAPFRPVWYGFAFSHNPLASPAADYCVRIRGRQFWRYELAGEREASDWAAWSREHLAGRGEWLEYQDRGARRSRAARLLDGRLQACLFVGPTHDLPTRTWLAQLFAETSLDATARASLLTARPPVDQPDAGATLCSCFGVGRNALIEAIQRDRLTTPEAVGAALRAGTNCGSCVPELRALIDDTLRQPVAKVPRSAQIAGTTGRATRSQGPRRPPG
jgi:assimilatory nitrate reductase catalytic subunit